MFQGLEPSSPNLPPSWCRVPRAIILGTRGHLYGYIWLYMGIYGLKYVFWMSGLVFRCLDLYFGCLDFIFLVFGLVLGCLDLIFRCLDLYSGYCIPVVCLYSCWVSVYL